MHNKSKLLVKYEAFKPEILGLLVAFLALNLWYLSSIAVAEHIIPIGYEYIAKGVTVLTGAFVGAFSAFKLNDVKDTKAISLERKAQLKKAIFIVIRQIALIDAIKTSMSPFQTAPQMAFQMPTGQIPRHNHLTFDFEGLSFLLDEYANTVNRMFLVEDDFALSCKLIELRNDFHKTEIQHAFSDKKIDLRIVSPAQLSGVLGERLFETAICNAKNAKEQVNLTIDSLHSFYAELREVALKLYPNDTFPYIYRNK